jgi:Protein of unknown function (DUF2961).
MNTLSYLQSLTQIADARTCRASSWDQSGRNKDYWLIDPGKTVILADIEGPGCINHIWMTTFCRNILGPSIQDPVLGASVAPVTEMENAIGVNWEINDPDYYRKVLIKMTWDDQNYPSILVPLGDFFCIGHSMPASFSSIPFHVSSRPQEEYHFGGTSAMNCYFPMPFNGKAKIEIINDNERPLGLFFHIDYEIYHQKKDNLAYFHAKWHREKPCEGWGADLAVNTPEVNGVSNLYGEDNYVFLDVQGEGHYVGCNLSVTHFQGSWWGEGDDMIFIDGEKIASIMGTGSEDYFNHAWGMQRNTSLYSGTIVHESIVPGYQVSYRFHITDPVHFKKSIKVTMEHGHANHLSDDWASTAYWYQTLPSQEVTIAAVEERIPLKKNQEVVYPKNIHINTEADKAKKESQKRHEQFLKEKQNQIKLNAARTDAASEGNINASKQIRKSFDQSK